MPKVLAAPPIFACRCNKRHSKPVRSCGTRTDNLPAQPFTTPFGDALFGGGGGGAEVQAYAFGPNGLQNIAPGQSQPPSRTS